MAHFIRTPTWIAPPSYITWKSGKVVEILGSLDMDGENFTPKQIEKLKTSPVYYLELVKAVEEQINGRFPMVGLRMPLHIVLIQVCKRLTSSTRC
jgi:hypothetical protein